MVSICFVRILMLRLKVHLHTDAGIVDSYLIATEASTYAALVADVTEKLGQKWQLPNNFAVYHASHGCRDDYTEHVQLQADADVTTFKDDDHLIIYPYNTETQVEIPDNIRPTADAGNALEICVSGIPRERTRTEVRDYLHGRFGPIERLYYPEKDPSDILYANVTFKGLGAAQNQATISPCLEMTSASDPPPWRQPSPSPPPPSLPHEPLDLAC